MLKMLARKCFAVVATLASIAKHARTRKQEWLQCHGHHMTGPVGVPSSKGIAAII